MSISGNFKFENNCFDPIRYWAAFCVMFLHYTFYALTLSDQAHGFMTVLRNVVGFFPGVVVLFALSGYLVSSSLERSADARQYLIKRVFRLYPELWVCTLVNLITVCVLTMRLPDKSILIWLATQVFGIANTPDSLKDFATGSINGALWTIFTEIQLYIVLCVLRRWLKKFSHTKWIVLIVVSAAVNLICYYIDQNTAGMIPKLLERTFIPYFLWFVIGAYCFYKKESVVPVLKKLLIPLLAVYTVLRLGSFITVGYYSDIGKGILCPLIVIGAAYALGSVRIKCDLSYGIFLYHWIVLNVLVHYDLLNKLHWVAAILIYTSATLALAYLSWRFVGKASDKIVKKLSA